MEELILEQKRLLEAEKAEALRVLMEAEETNIADVRIKAADEAERLYTESLKAKVDAQFKIAEDHINAILVKIAPVQTNEELENNEE